MHHAAGDHDVVIGVCGVGVQHHLPHGHVHVSCFVLKVIVTALLAIICSKPVT